MDEREDKVGPRAQEPVKGWMAADAVANLTEVAAYRYPGEICAGSREAPLVFGSNEALWKAILEGVDVTENRRVELRSFWLTEWMPLRPGRYHTSNAQFARREAMRHSLIQADDERAPEGLRCAVGGARGRPHTRIFNPGGKMKMVDGGIGCVRLKPLPNRKPFRWAFGASSSTVVHEGALVALSDDARDQLIGDVRRFGGLCGTLTGTMRFVPREDVTESMFGRGIPQMYIEVDRFEPAPLGGSRVRTIDVTAAVTFTSRAEDYPGLNVSYVTFNAARRGDMDRAVDWLESVYVREAYRGTIVTDFDEQTAHFERARFSLHKLLNGLVSRADVASVDDELRLSGELVDILNRRGIVVFGDVHGDIYSADQAVAIGRNATVSDTDVTINRDSRR